jgi:branched-chain amino acid transport system substrate-binding protein
VVKQCGDDLSRENIMKQAANLKKLVLPTAIAGVEITTSATDFRPVSQMRLAKFNGTTFVPISEVINGE